MTTTISDFPNLWKSEKLGDPCPCGCGGVKALPPGTKARTLWILLACEGCSAERSYPNCAKHNKLCVRCVRLSRTNPSAPDHSQAQMFDQRVRAAARRKGVSLEGLCEEAGISYRGVYDWVRGRHTPKRSTLEALAKAANDPDLVNILPSKFPWILVTCPNCGKKRTYGAGALLAEINRKRPGTTSADINWTEGVGEYLCVGCSGRNSLEEYTRKQVKRHGRKFFEERGRQLGRGNSSEHLLHASQAAVAARKNKVWTEEERLRASVSRITPYLKGKFGICRLCRLIVFSGNRLDRAEAHSICLNNWRTKNKKRVSAYPPRPFRNTPKPEYLATSYELCVRHLLRGEDIGEYKHGGTGTGLAKEFDQASQTIIKRIKRFLLALPTDGRGSQPFARRTEHLLAVARDRFGYDV